MPEKHSQERTIRLYQSGIHPCSYLDNHNARTQFIYPETISDTPLYANLIDQGFRRSGNLIYRPDCPHCQECTSLRIPVRDFTPRRSQQRVWKQNVEHLRVLEEPAGKNPEHYRLFKRYIAARHQDGSMANTSEEEYRQFITSHWSNTRSFAFYREQTLLAVAVSDLLPQGLSAVYTFFDPTCHASSPGVFTILWQINECRRRNLPWLYLGYWINSCHKMTYKKEYLPHEIFCNNQWMRIEKEKPGQYRELE